MTQKEILLTKSQQVVIGMKARGLTDKQVAHLTKIKYATITQMISRLKTKYNQPDITALVVECIKQKAIIV